MFIILLPSDETTEDRARARHRELAAFFAFVASEKAERSDRRRFRWLLCGEHGFVRNFRETCPNCGGYAEPLKNQAMARRLSLRKQATKRLMKTLAARRAKT